MVSTGGSSESQQGRSYVFRGQEPYLLDIYGRALHEVQQQTPDVYRISGETAGTYIPWIRSAVGQYPYLTASQNKQLSDISTGVNPASRALLGQTGNDPAMNRYLSALQNMSDIGYGNIATNKNPALTTLRGMMAGGINPNLKGMVGAASNVLTDELRRNILPSINQSGNAANPYGGGGSRQGIAEGLALSDANRQLSDFATNLYGQAYDADQARRIAASQAYTGVLENAANRALQASTAAGQLRGADLQRQQAAAQSYIQNIFGAGEQAQQNQQALLEALLSGTQGLINLGLTPYQQIWNQLLNYKQLVSDPAILQSNVGSGRSSDFSFL